MRSIICTKCQLAQSLPNNSWCKDCTNKYYRERRRRVGDEGHAARYNKSQRGYWSVRLAQHKHRMGGDVSLQDWLDKVEESGWNCHYCGLHCVNKDLHIDHRIPFASGGLHSIENIVPACSFCNFAKHNRTEDELMEWLRGVAERLSR